MSRFDELQTAPPSGVPFKAIADVTSNGASVRWSDSGDASFQYIDLTSVDRVTRKIGETATITSVDAPSRAQQIIRTGDVIFATTRPAQMRWAVIPPEFDGQIASTGYCVMRPDTSQVITGYLAHLLGTNSFRQYIEANQVAGNYPSIPDRQVRAFRIPVPTLEVQREIARILDQFTQLEAELEAELGARRLQYAHYSREIFEAVGIDCPTERIGDVAVVKYGRDFPRSMQGRPVGKYPFFKVVDMTRPGNEMVMTEAANYVESADLSEMSTDCSPSGTILLPRVGAAIATNKKRILGVPAAFDTSFIALVPGHAIVPRYLLFWLGGVDLLTLANTGAALPSVRRDALEALRIPVPPLAEQQRIVAVLDRFHALVNDLSSGLPAELAARRKQYEYYRDKLLSFDETPA